MWKHYNISTQIYTKYNVQTLQHKYTNIHKQMWKHYSINTQIYTNNIVKTLQHRYTNNSVETL